MLKALAGFSCQFGGLTKAACSWLHAEDQDQLQLRLPSHSATYCTPTAGMRFTGHREHTLSPGILELQTLCRHMPGFGLTFKQSNSWISECLLCCNQPCMPPKGPTL